MQDVEITETLKQEIIETSMNVIKLAQKGINISFYDILRPNMHKYTPCIFERARRQSSLCKQASLAQYKIWDICFGLQDQPKYCCPRYSERPMDLLRADFSRLRLQSQQY